MPVGLAVRGLVGINDGIVNERSGYVGVRVSNMGSRRDGLWGC